MQPVAVSHLQAVPETRLWALYTHKDAKIMRFVCRFALLMQKERE